MQSFKTCFPPNRSPGIVLDRVLWWDVPNLFKFGPCRKQRRTIRQQQHRILPKMTLLLLQLKIQNDHHLILEDPLADYDFFKPKPTLLDLSGAMAQVEVLPGNYDFRKPNLIQIESYYFWKLKPILLYLSMVILIHAVEGRLLVNYDFRKSKPSRLDQSQSPITTRKMIQMRLPLLNGSQLPLQQLLLRMRVWIRMKTLTMPQLNWLLKDVWPN
mmetsp:Transcript_31459/g.48263  ORF Transcript_31459/g.48263 Transcript_31459/m.48263 type:complete len:214 (+) Transcript_31459:438-1079(+)